MSEPPESSSPSAEPRPAALGQAEGSSAGLAGRVRELEHVVVRCESQVKGLLQRMGDLETAHRVARRRALLFRLALLVLLLSAYVVVRARYSS